MDPDQTAPRGATIVVISSLRVKVFQHLAQKNEEHQPWMHVGF